MKTIDEKLTTRPETTDTTQIATRLMAGDRCDACGHRAYIHVQLVMGEFTFCGHHGRHLRTAMQPYLVSIDDQTATIDSKKY